VSICVHLWLNSLAALLRAFAPPREIPASLCPLCLCGESSSFFHHTAAPQPSSM
jgi:hypothetical protein